MFIGHFALGFAAKRATPRLSLGWLFVAAQLADILWSARNGLFSTTPILYLAAIGLAIFAVARPAIGLPMIASIAVMVYFNACIQDWWGSAGFG